MPAGVHNGITIVEPERSNIVIALAAGESVRSIAARLRHHWLTVEAVREAEWSRVEARKPILRAQAERNALLAGEQIAEALANRKFPVGSLPIVYGVSVDKSVALQPSDAPTSQHLHLHLAPQDIAGTFNSFLHSLQAKAREIEDVTPPSSPDTSP